MNRWEVAESVSESLQEKETKLGTDRLNCLSSSKVKQSVTGLEWPRGFQEVKVPRFHDNGTGWW